MTVPTAHEMRCRIAARFGSSMTEPRRLVRGPADPSKSAAPAAACDFWWLALGDPRLLREGDQVPDGWGVMAAHGRGLQTIREPARRQGVRDERFVAGLLMAAMRSSTYRRAQGYQAGYHDAEQDAAGQLKRLQTLYEFAARALPDDQASAALPPAPR